MTMSKIKLLGMALPVLLVLVPLVAHAQGIEIATGGNVTVTDAATIDISNGGLVNNGIYTKGTETVTISGTTAGSISGTSTTSLNNLIINPGAKLNLNASTTLNVANFTIKSDVNGTGTFIDNGTSSFTNTNVEQYMIGSGGATPNGRGYYISSPVASALSSVLTASGGNGLYSHIESASGQGYSEITSDAVALNPMQGYVVRLGSSVAYTFTGGALNKGTYSISGMTKTAEAGTRSGFHLIGNPYPSFLNWNTAIDAGTKDGLTTNISPTIYYRTVNGSNVHVFDTYNATNHTGTNTNGLGLVTRYIAPLQAVWVRVDGVDGSTGTLAFNNSMREHVSGATLRNIEVADLQSVRLRVSNGSNEDEAILLYSEKALDELDAWDSPKMSNNNTSIPEIYTYAGNEKVVINGLTEKALEKALVLGFKTGKAGTFSIKLSENKLADGSCIVLKDNLLNIEQNLTEVPVYEFYSAIVATDSRFTLAVSKTATALDVDVDALTPLVQVYQSNVNEVTVTLAGPQKPDSRVTIYNTLGQQMASSPILGEKTVLSNLSKPGVYLISVESGGKKSVSKFVINPF